MLKIGERDKNKINRKKSPKLFENHFIIYD